MLNRIQRALAFTMVGLMTITATGCFGSFHLTRTVYGFNAGLDNKFVRTLVMWGLLIIPVYELAALGDVLIFNVIEFWSGNAPAASNTLPDGTKVSMEKVGNDVLRVRVTPPGQRTEELEVVKVNERSGYLRRPGGAPLVTIEQAADGRTVVTEQPSWSTEMASLPSSIR